MSSPDGHVWAWDLYPLAEHAWPNTYVQTSSPPGYEVTLLGVPSRRGDVEVFSQTTHEALGRAKAEALRRAGEPTRRGEPAKGARIERVQRRRGYRPSAENLAVLQHVFPDADAENPSWVTIEAKLVAGGYDESQLKGRKAPILVQLLGRLYSTQLKPSKPEPPAGGEIALDGDERTEEQAAATRPSGEGLVAGESKQQRGLDGEHHAEQKAPEGWWARNDAIDYVATHLLRNKQRRGAAEQHLYRWAKKRPEIKYGKGRGCLWNPNMVRKGCQGKL